MLIEDGVLNEVDAIFAWHIAPECQFGEINLSAGPCTNAASTYRIEVNGKSGHGAFVVLISTIITPILVKKLYK